MKRSVWFTKSVLVIILLNLETCSCDNGLHIRNLMNDVAAKVPAKWRAIGIQLELPSGTLDSIQQEHARQPQADQHSFETMLNIWKQLAQIPYTWKTIIDALKAPSVGENQLADDLEAKYIRIDFLDQPISSDSYSSENGIKFSKEIGVKNACNIIVVGRTGDGKSTLCRALAVRLGLPENDTTIFQSSSAIHSHTCNPEIWASMNPTIRLMDTPGLMDTGGVGQDEEKIVKIVQNVSTLGYVNGFILVVNEQTPRFDRGMQDVVKLLVDSFGSMCLTNFAIVYNRAFGTVSPSDSAKRTAEYTKVIMNRTAIPINHLPSWQVDCKPEILRSIGLTEEIIKDRIALRDRTLDEIIRWARAKNPVDTTGAVIGEYEQRRKAREEEEKRKEAYARRIYDQSVILTETETKIDVYKRNSQAIMFPVQIMKASTGWFERVINLLFPDYWTETKLVEVGKEMTLHWKESQRIVNTLGSGQKVYGEWKIVREWME